jgi:hypothetical protein
MSGMGMLLNPDYQRETQRTLSQIENGSWPHMCTSHVQSSGRLDIDIGSGRAFGPAVGLG